MSFRQRSATTSPISPWGRLSFATGRSPMPEVGRPQSIFRPLREWRKSMDNVRGKWALVTGASSGFGVEFATLLAEQHANLILAARRTEPMKGLAELLRQKHHVDVVVEGIDLSLAGAAAELKSRLDTRGITVDV